MILIYSEDWLNETTWQRLLVYIPFSFSSHQRHLEGLWKQMAGPFFCSFWLSRSGRDLRISISIKFQFSLMLLQGLCSENHCCHRNPDSFCIAKVCSLLENINKCSCFWWRFGEGAWSQCPKSRKYRERTFKKVEVMCFKKWREVVLNFNVQARQRSFSREAWVEKTRGSNNRCKRTWKKF